MSESEQLEQALARVAVLEAALESVRESLLRMTGGTRAYAALKSPGSETQSCLADYFQGLADECKQALKGQCA